MKPQIHFDFQDPKSLNFKNCHSIITFILSQIAIAQL